MPFHSSPLFFFSCQTQLLINTHIQTHDICMSQPFAGAHRGIKSWLRAASLAKVAMRTLMALGAQLGVLACGRSWVISKSTASRLSKKRVICSTVQRLSWDTDRNSPTAHTWATGKHREREMNDC